jgi:hypothetical protein
VLVRGWFNALYRGGSGRKVEEAGRCEDEAAGPGQGGDKG